MAAKVDLFGIKNCDAMAKARAWLAAHGVAYVFHDYKTEGVERSRLQAWVQQLGWEIVLNRAGTTFRALPDAAKADLNAAKAVKLMAAQPSMIKRPMLEAGGRLMAGFKPDAYSAFFGSGSGTK